MAEKVISNPIFSAMISPFSNCFLFRPFGLISSDAHPKTDAVMIFKENGNSYEWAFAFLQKPCGGSLRFTTCDSSTHASLPVVIRLAPHHLRSRFALLLRH